MSRKNLTGCVLAASTLALLATGAVRAEFIGLNINESHWASPTSNTFRDNDPDRINLVDDLELTNPEETSRIIVLEHPISALPNIKYQGSQLDSNANIHGQTLGSGDQGTSTFDLSSDDLVLYYQLFNDGIDLDLGVDVKRLDGEISYAGATDRTVEVDETIPLLYLSARFDLPMNGLYVGANLNADVIDLGVSESTAQDSTIMLGYDSGNGVGLAGGYKHFSLDLNNADAPDTDLEYDGIFLNGYINF